MLSLDLSCVTNFVPEVLVDVIPAVPLLQAPIAYSRLHKSNLSKIRTVIKVGCPFVDTSPCHLPLER